MAAQLLADVRAAGVRPADHPDRRPHPRSTAGGRAAPHPDRWRAVRAVSGVGHVPRAAGGYGAGADRRNRAAQTPSAAARRGHQLFRARRVDLLEHRQWADRRAGVAGIAGTGAGVHAQLLHRAGARHRRVDRGLSPGAAAGSTGDSRVDGRERGDYGGVRGGAAAGGAGGVSNE